MAFTDALIDHADVRVAMVDRLTVSVGIGSRPIHLSALHQASDFYAVASTLLGDGRVQQRGPKSGLHERRQSRQRCDRQLQSRSRRSSAARSL
jgi:hypothetical protein